MNQITFSVNESRLTTTRQFDAPLETVWEAWTTAELLDQWWAPAPFVAKTRHFDFSVGGYRFYSMSSPDGQTFYGRMEYESISDQKSFSGTDAFAFEDGSISEEAPMANFLYRFKALDGGTEVVTITKYASEEQLQMVLAMGLEQGLNQAYQNLDQLLAG